jgi:hypothetical protein
MAKRPQYTKEFKLEAVRTKKKVSGTISCVSEAWGRGGCPWCYFLKRSFKARRGSSGRPDPDDVSRSTVARSEKNVHSLRARLSGMRSGTGWVHSNRWPGAKWVHWLKTFLNVFQRIRLRMFRACGLASAK